MSVDHFHTLGETLQANELFIEPGGKAYNQAVAAHRLGVKSYFFGALGDDAAGKRCNDFLKQEGVIPVLEILPKYNTAYACILTDQRGENRVTVSRGAAQHLSADFIYSHEEEIQCCTHMILGLECPIEVVCAALELCHKHGVYTIFNPAPALPLNLDFLHQFDLITPNKQEASVLLKLQEDAPLETLVNALQNAGFQQAVVTLGSQGSLLIENGTAYLYPAHEVIALDTTGAGDTFNAALAVSLSLGRTLHEAVVYATSASAWSVERKHVMESLPTKEDLSELIATLKPIKL